MLWHVTNTPAEQVWGSILFSIFISIFILFSTNYFQIFEIRLFDIKQSYNYIPAHLIYDIIKFILFLYNKRPTGLHGHLINRDRTLTSYKKGSYLTLIGTP